jgi:rubrerythrin
MKSREILDTQPKTTDAELFFNRTGVMTSPDLSAELIRGAKKTKPSSKSEDKQMASKRTEYLTEGFPIGSPPVIVTNDARKEEEVSAEADRMSVLLDKLGERLAFERQGTRLYEGFLQKLEGAPSVHDSGPSVQDLRDICDEEFEHFLLLQKAIGGIGGDATVQTPSADVVGVLSHGIMQIVSDPRTTIPQTLQAILNAELADNDGWQMLKGLAAQLGYAELERKCEKALQEEQEHLGKVRAWLSEMTITEALGEEGVLEIERGQKSTAKRRAKPSNRAHRPAKRTKKRKK